jgi:ABC-type Fe3+-hydroxamate transport system substrate-binding protein
MRRRDFLSGLGGLAALSVVGACANPANRVTDSPVADSPTTDPSTTAAPSFPAAVRHRYGTTTVPTAPRRVVTLGQTDHDAVIALGVVPTAVAGFVGGSYSPVRPWNAGAFPTKPPVLNMQEIEFEKVATLRPDLILAVMSGVTRGDYAKLSAIAPTVAQPVDHEDWAVPYRPHTELIGAALGRTAAARRLVDDLGAGFASAREEHPILGGKRAACVEFWGSDFAVLGTGAPRTAFLTDLGMVLSEPLRAIAGRGYNAALSAEKVDLLDDLDVVVWTTDHADADKLLHHRLVEPLRTTREGRYLLATDGGDDDLLYSMDWGSVLSHRWALTHAVPRLVKAADGDVATDPQR